MSNGTLLVATVGQAVIRSADDGKTWHRLGLGQDLEFDAITRSLSVHPGARGSLRRHRHRLVRQP